MTDYLDQLLSPDFAGFESYYGCAVPLELRQFYELQKSCRGVLYATIKIGEQMVRVDLIQYANPMNSQNWTERYGVEFYRFATNTDGYPLLIKPAQIGSPIFADFADQQPVPDIEELEFSLREIIASLGNP